jgi:hypothetical protein
VKSKELLVNARVALDGTNLWVDSLVLRRYLNGCPDSFRIDDSTNEVAEVPVGYTHVLVVFETSLDSLLDRVRGPQGR